MKSTKYDNEPKIRHKLTPQDTQKGVDAYLCKPRGKTWKSIVDEMLSQNEVDVSYSSKVPHKKGFRVIKRHINLNAGERLTIRHLITAKQIELAMQGNMSALSDIQDRDYGKPRQALEHSLTSPLDEGQGDPDALILTMIKKVVDK